MAGSLISVLRPPRYELRQIRAFVCVADELHFGRAASRLYTTQPALSRTIRSLEDIVGHKLFVRSTRKVRLTPAGEAFATECRLALAHLELAATAAQNADAAGKSRLRMAYMDFAINGRLPRIIQAFRAREPQVVLDLDYMSTAAQQIALLAGRIDLGFLVGEFKTPKVKNLLVDEDEYVAVLPEGHRLATVESLRLADIAGEPFVIGNEEMFSRFRSMLFDLCYSAGFFPNVVQEASNSNGILGLVAAGTGITIYASSVRSILRTGVVVRPFADVTAKIPIVAASLADHPSAALARFLDVTAEHAHRRGGW